MPFDRPTRNRLQRFVGEARDLLLEEFTHQLQADYGMDPKTGKVTAMERLGHLDDTKRETARLLREILAHYQTTEALPAAKAQQSAVKRIAREQAFTVLNRLAALRMMEARGLLMESVSKDYQSQAFQLFSNVAGNAMGDTGNTYRHFLFSLFDEFTGELNVLFDRHSPHGRLFPDEPSLLKLLELINDDEIAPLWEEDETIGWIYQYYNDPDERKRMRKASAAPRNSRELAVRNQFFTPRYVVEFLTDNTLGRIWYEMTKGETRLKDQCRYLVRRPTEIFLEEGEEAPEQKDTDENISQEELLKQPVHIPHRPVKDPREIRLLDPACGSMHFGLYAFDLFETIYEEAWDKRLYPVLQEVYPSKDDYLRDVPRLIIEHNIHGVDIDPRAVQIAGLSLWLRAQRSWKNTPATKRPQIRRSNVVCAEPMPGSQAMLDDFVESLDPPLLGELIRTVFDKMKLAGEAGTLLKIEEEIRSAVDEAREAWEELKGKSYELFSTDQIDRVGDQPRLRGLDTALRVPDSQLSGEFFDTAEERIYIALRGYAESAEAGDYQRRLFAEDAAHGFSFIDLCRQRYDAIVMNPPFGDCCSGAKDYIFSQHERERTEIGACFLTRMTSMIHDVGIVGMISNRTFLFAGSFQEWRDQNLQGLLNCADLGFGVLDALVETAAFAVTKRKTKSTTFFGLLGSCDKGPDLLSSISENTCDFSGRATFVRQAVDRPRLGTGWYYYWMPPRLLEDAHKLAANSTQNLIAKPGLQTCDNFRYLRTSWEIRLDYNTHRVWKRVSKGGEYKPFWSDLYLVAKWEDDGHEMKSFIETKYDSWSKQIPSSELYGKPGLTYSERTTSSLSIRILPADCLFDKQGPFIGFRIDEPPRNILLLFLVASYTFPNRSLMESFVGLRDATEPGSPARHYMPSLVESLPLPPNVDRYSRFAPSIGKMVHFQRRISQLDITDSFFTPGEYSDFDSIEDASSNALENLNSEIIESVAAFAEIEREFISDLGLTTPDILQLRKTFHRPLSDYPESDELNPTEVQDLLAQAEGSLVEQAVSAAGQFSSLLKQSHVVNRPIELVSAILNVSPLSILKTCPQGGTLFDEGSLTVRLIDEIIGETVGRWDIRYSTGERQPPELLDPFDPLPVCPPGMLQNADGLPAAPADVPNDYPLRITWPGILVDDDGHPEEIVARVRDALAVIWGDRSAAIEQEACEILGVRTLRDYFAEKKSGSKFFKDHLKRYSKSRRKAPIYWPLSTQSGSYTLWVYYHQLNSQTLFSCVNDFVEPKLESVESTIQTLQSKSSRSSAEEKELEEFTDLSVELIEFRDTLLSIAGDYKPNLNDGVQISAAPLWSLFRLKAWQKVLKQTWDKLEAGDYDWAHLALAYWPDRVVRTAHKDRSIAIAHDLEDDLWHEVEDSGRRGKSKRKWQPCDLSEEQLDKIVERFK